jgi:[ribosomal protein S18]-alanine N-acetyltransferase
LSDIELRPGSRGDLVSIAQIQAVSPEASQWDVQEYLKYELLVAVCGGRVAGFAVARRLAEGEAELLNLAVDPAFRRRGVGRRLVAEVASFHPGMLWLEVRESNANARKFYQSLGFCEAGCRPSYYPDSAEGAIVMNVHS